MAKKKRKTNPLLIILFSLVGLLSVGVCILLFLNRGGLPSSKFEVMLDAGHDSNEVGYTSSIQEYEYTQEVTSRLYTLLEGNSDIKVSLTHEKDQPLTLEKRLEVIEREKPDMIVSIHAGYDPSPNMRGMRIITQLPSNPKHEQSVLVAKEIQKAFDDETNFVAVGYYYYVPTHNEMFALSFVPVEDKTEKEFETLTILQNDKYPTVVVEGFNINNPEEVATFTSEEGYQKAAEQYYKAILKYIENTKKEN